MEPTIRPATLKDLAPLCELYREFFRYNAMLQPNYCQIPEEQGDYPRSVLEGDTGAIFVAVSKNGMEGFVHVETCQTPPYPSLIHHRYGEVVDVYVRQETRRQGTGKLLFQAALDWMRQQDLDHVELMVVENNPGAIRFYRAMGLTPAHYTMRMTLD